MTNATKMELVAILMAEIEAIRAEIAPFSHVSEIMGEWYADRIELIEAKQWRIDNTLASL